MSEDCLTLNIWRPASAKAADKPLPVMVWIHGGGFVSGSGQIPGDVLAQEGVIVVSMNYRLGALGFFAHPQLDNPVANFGLSDVVKALRWVQRNIGTFNGDKDNVTIFGVSAGGMMVNLLLVNQQASGSFHKAISQSGYIAWPLPVKEKQNQFAVRDVYGNTMLHAEQQGREKASQWLEGEATLKQLKALPGEVITGRFEGFYSPIVDGVTLENQPYKLVKTHSNEVSLITGGNSFEGSVMPYSGYTVPQYLQSWKTFPGQVDLLYKEDWNHSHERAAKRAFGDERYLFSAYFLGQQWQHKPSPAWLYYIDQKPTKESPGSPHGYDQQLIFNTFKSQDAKTQRLAKTLRNYWVNFAKSGSPVLNTDKTWSANTQGHPTWLVLPSETEEVNLYATRFKSIKTRLENRESTEGNGQ
ncbi:carboxylesterase/lipase family protein [Halioxenophilus aromaticivorans]|uniref:Carboxylesterase/lipase family protein n=2 Tax=Halioxenophilus aromaticivorans TaxID=1306992 RepID=A0AAV3U3L4_9ALTE